MSKPTKVAFLLTPQCAMMALTSAIEAMRGANRQAGENFYEWIVLSADDGPVTTSSGLVVMPNAHLDEVEDLDYVFACGGIRTDQFNDPHVFAWLRRQAQHGTAIGALSTGTFILAAAGLLKGYRATIHWEGAVSLQEKFPEVELTGAIFEIDRNRYTCAGGTTAMDLMLTIISRDHGSRLATEVSRQFLHDRIRDNTDQQEMVRKLQLAIKSEKLLKAVAVMEANIETPISPEEIAAEIGLSARQLERLFSQHVSTSPAKYYVSLRLEHARLLLLQTGLSIVEVAVASGFVSHSHFAKRYRQKFGCSPFEERRRGDVQASPLPEMDEEVTEAAAAT